MSVRATSMSLSLTLTDSVFISECVADMSRDDESDSDTLVPVRDANDGVDADGDVDSSNGIWTEHEEEDDDDDDEDDDEELDSTDVCSTRGLLIIDAVPLRWGDRDSSPRTSLSTGREIGHGSILGSCLIEV